MLKAIRQSAVMNPTFNSYWLSAAINQSFPFYEVGIVGNNFHNERKKISRLYLPNIVLFGGSHESELDLLTDRYVPDKTLLYVCENRVCQLPVENLDEAIKQILR
jgi:uncharacterized protein YyaL (SSP411 family)